MKNVPIILGLFFLVTFSSVVKANTLAVCLDAATGKFGWHWSNIPSLAVNTPIAEEAIALPLARFRYNVACLIPPFCPLILNRFTQAARCGVWETY